MKTLCLAVVSLALGTTWAAAQDISHVAQPVTSAPATAQDVTGFMAPSWAPGPGMTSKQMQTPPNPHPNLKPKLGGIFVDGAKYGPEIISPTAPPEWGNGERYLSAPSPMQDVQHISGSAAHRDSGGFKLFSFEF